MVKIIVRSGDKQTTKSHKKIYLSWHKKISWFHHVAGYFCQAGLFKTCDSTFVWTQEQLLGYYRLTYGDFGEMNQ
jgi:hypothetical protein